MAVEVRLKAQERDAGKGLLVVFAPDITDMTTIKRVHQFMEHGFGVMVFGFRRSRYNRGYAPSWPHVELGHTADRRYWRRSAALLRALRLLWLNRATLKRASVFYARNLDQLILSLIVRRLYHQHAPVVYEVLDVQPTLTGGGLPAMLLRRIERWGLRRIRLLVVSSPGFIDNFYAPVQRFRRPWFLLENKLDAATLPALAMPPERSRRKGAHAGFKWVVGYFGRIRGRRTFDLMTRLAARCPDVLFKFRGVLTTVEQPHFLAALRRHRNIVYEGDYVSPRDLPTLYGEVDFAWAIDLEHVEHNSRWLLPCRFYEAGLFGVPCLAADAFEVGRKVARLGAGWTFAPPYEEALGRFFANLSAADYAATRRRLAALPSSTFVAGEDVVSLCRLLRGEPQPPARATELVRIAG